MVKSLHITVADKVFEEIFDLMKKEGKTNRSEFVEELIRTGLLYHE